MGNQSRPPKIGVFLLFLVLLIAIPLVQAVIFTFSPLKPHSTESAIFEVQKGQNPNELTKALINRGIISQGKKFLWVGRIGRQWSRVKAGEYRFSPTMSPASIFSVLTSGVSMKYPLTLREGENMYELAQDLESKNLAKKEEFLALCKNPDFIASLGLFHDLPPTSLEGYLFPDTYFFNKAMTNTDMIKQMVKHFFDFWGPHEQERSIQLKLTRHEIITLASMIEKETGAPEERPLISSIFHNRLHLKMRLQSDPTTIYGMWDRYHGKIHKKDLLEKNKYNTYTIQALPVGPIANPGKESIQAALFPAESPFLYFVSHNDGTHKFSKTIQEHNQAVQKYQLDPKARLGKSWRDRLKNNQVLSKTKNSK